MRSRTTNLEHQLKPNTAAATVKTTVAGTAKLLSGMSTAVTIHANTSHVMIGVEDNAVRVCPEGGTPTATDGQKIAADRTVLMSKSEAALAKFISTTGTATLQVSQYITD